jgi:hypothetical protein
VFAALKKVSTLKVSGFRKNGSSGEASRGEHLS